MMQRALASRIKVMMLTEGSIAGGNGERNLRTGSSTPLRLALGDMEFNEAKRPKQLGDENARLKKLLAESAMDVSPPRETPGIAASDRHWPEGACRGF